MWAQIIKTRLKPGNDAELIKLMDQLKAIEQPDSGLLRSTAMRDQQDPDAIYLMVVFDSEESARARERDPRREEGLGAVRDTMARIIDGPREFINLDVVVESVFPTV
jgi:quinol monooxygenase YgiN